MQELTGARRVASVEASSNGLRGEIAFASPEAQVQRTAELLGDGAIVCSVPPLSSAMRRRLAEHLDDAIEHELARRGAPSPYLASWSALPDDVEARLADQLFRARTVGATGIALVMGSLACVASPALSEEDSAMLRLLARAARTAPLALILDDADAILAGYTDPIALPALLGAPPESGVRAAAAPAPAPVREPERAPEPEPSAFIDLEIDLEVDEPPDADTYVDARVAPLPRFDEAIEEPPLDETPLDASDIDDAARRLEEEKLAIAQQIAKDNEARAKRLAEEDARREADAARQRDEARESAREKARSPEPAFGDAWRPWVAALAEARGPQPLAAFERIFVESYMPLCEAIAHGLDEPRALRAYDDFRRTFERAYADAFATFGVTSRRPRLVMDAYDFASKQARLHNARASHVVLVDSMRWDVGAMVRDEIASRASGVASLTSEILLFSALPTTTMRQLETLARGLDALRAPSMEEPSESLRGRTAETVRRMRVGSRELYKLDVLPSMLGSLEASSKPSDVAARLADAAHHVADALCRHLETLAPRTLLLVLGDHGFCVDRRGRVTHGGASPEEVIVPAYAFLVGDLH